MDYIVSESFEDSLSVERTIFNFGVQLAVQAGCEINDSGGIVGKKQGVSSSDSQATMSWDTPRERAAGKWSVLHPKYHPSASDDSALASLESLLGEITVEPFQSDWFPQEEV